ncbi:MAG: TolC family protein [Fimbriimonas sp.]
MKAPIAYSCLLLVAQAAGQSLTLPDALAQARKNRPIVRAANLGVEEARLTARALGTHPGLTLGVGRSSREGIGATDQDLFVALPIDYAGRTGAARKIGRAQVEIAEADAREALLELQTEVMGAYFEALASARLSQVAQDLKSVAESLYKATNRRFEEGKIPEVQLTRIGIELERAKQVAQARESRHRNDLQKLAGIIGATTAPEKIDLATNLAIPDVNPATRPDIARLEAKVRVADSEIELARRASLPEAEIIGLRTPWQDSAVFYGARLQLTWNGLDFGRASNERKASAKHAEAAKLALLDARRKVEVELTSVNAEIEAARQRVESYEAIRRTTTSLVEKSQRGYNEGFSGFLDVLDSIRALREIEQELAEAQLELNIALTTKYRVVGKLLEVTK